MFLKVELMMRSAQNIGNSVLQFIVSKISTAQKSRRQANEMCE